MDFFNEDNVVDAQRYAVNAKSSIQKNGRMGFTREAADLLQLADGQTMMFSANPDGDFGAVICDENEKRGFKVQKAGTYFYIRMKNVFDSQGLDYIGKRVAYDISETGERFQDKTVYKFKRGIFERRSSDPDDETPESEE